MSVAEIAARVEEGLRVTAADALQLYQEAPTPLLGRLADGIRARKHPDGVVSYIIDRNVNYTNVCYFKCGFCAFSKGRLAENLRGPAYLLDVDEVARRAAEAWARGGTEVCLQGGIHPGFTGAW